MFSTNTRLTILAQTIKFHTLDHLYIYKCYYFLTIAKLKILKKKKKHSQTYQILKSNKKKLRFSSLDGTRAWAEDERVFYETTRKFKNYSKVCIQPMFTYLKNFVKIFFLSSDYYYYYLVNLIFYLISQWKKNVFFFW